MGSGFILFCTDKDTTFFLPSEKLFDFFHDKKITGSGPVPLPVGFQCVEVYFNFLRISSVWFQNISTVLISMRSSGLWTPRSVGP